MAYQRKTFDTYEVQHRTTEGWEDVYSADSLKDAEKWLKDRRNQHFAFRGRIKCVRRPIPVDGVKWRVGQEPRS